MRTGMWTADKIISVATGNFEKEISVVQKDLDI